MDRNSKEINLPNQTNSMIHYSCKSKQSTCWCNCTLCYDNKVVALEAIGSLFAQVYWYENVRSISLKSEIDASIWRLKKMSFLWMTIKGIGGILI